MSENPFRLDGKTALVTGGGTGLGEAIALALVDAGATVAIAARRAATLHETAKRIGAHPFVADINDFTKIPALIAGIERQLGSLSILVNNAGIHLKAPALETTEMEFMNVIQTHLVASFALARAAARGMIERQHGSIVFIGSMAGILGIPSICAYTAAKGGVIALVAALASEWSASGVRVNTVSPGWIDTGMARDVLSKDPQRQARILQRTPMGRLGDAQDIGNAVVYLCSPAGRFVTGANMVVDGGASKGF